MNTLTLTLFQWKAWEEVYKKFGEDVGIEVLVLLDNTDLTLGQSIIKACGLQLDDFEPFKEQSEKGGRFCPFFAGLV